MDTIAFKVRTSDHWFGNEIEIEINGESLVSNLRAFEMPLGQAEGHPNIAGGYSGLPASSHLPPSRHFFGEQPHPETRKGRVELLLCGDCGEIGCWPILARIEVMEDRVVWSDFQQPHRTGGGKSAVWDYSGFGPFVFDRTQYEEALRQAAEPCSSDNPTSP
jgi:hypothetical protein